MHYPACSTPHVSPWTAGQACPRPVRSGPKYEQTPSSGTIVYKNIYCPWLGLEKKLEAREPARARGGSARLEPAREPHASRAEPISLARKNSEPSRASSVRLASRLASSAQHGSSRPRRQILPYSLPPPIGTESWSQGRRRYASCHV